ncbi:MAG TPA: hypothetical protein VGR73_01690 [Bryobacteraceae bacterium]|nr:hypothetical protein [Bryobacteraceae bacterium]
MGPFGGIGSKIVAYNDYGDPIEEIFEHVPRSVSIDDEGRLSDAPPGESVSRSQGRFRYDYDAHGNWVMKTVESRAGPDKDFSLSSVEKRTIAYFSAV